MNKVSNKDRLILRDLAKRYMEICHSERNQKAKDLWRDHNSLVKTRPPVYCMTDFASHFDEEINEILPPMLTDESLHAYEYWFHRKLWDATIPDDSVYDPWYGVGAIMQRPQVGLWGIEPKRVHHESSKSWHSVPVVKIMEDLEALKASPHLVLDDNPPMAQIARDIFGDILAVHVNKSTVYPIWGGTDLSEAAGNFIGLQEMAYMFYDNPEIIHKLMSFMRDSVLADLEQGEAAGDWSLVENQNYSLPPHTKELPEPKTDSYGASLKDLWFFTHAQEFEHVGSELHEEFLLNYQMPIMEKFALVNYGCCETLDKKIDLLRKIKNLRRICIGPTADLKNAAEQIAGDYVISWRPNPADMVSYGFDPDKVRKLIRQGLRDSESSSIEVLLKEVLTVERDISRLYKWTEIALEEANNI